MACRQCIKRCAIAMAAIAAVVGCIAVALHYRHVANMEYRNHIADLERRELARQINNVENGQSQEIRFTAYSGPGTDEKIQLIERLEHLRDIIFDRTDLTAAGLRRISAMGNVRRLAVLGSGISEDGLLAFEGNDSIEALVLVNTNASDRSIKVLCTFHRLRSLVLYDGNTPARFSFDGLQELSRLNSLRFLSVGGPWTMKDGDNGLRDLQKVIRQGQVTRLSYCPSSDATDLWCLAGTADLSSGAAEACP